MFKMSSSFCHYQNKCQMAFSILLWTPERFCGNESHRLISHWVKSNTKETVYFLKFKCTSLFLGNRKSDKSFLDLTSLKLLIILPNSFTRLLSDSPSPSAKGSSWCSCMILRKNFTTAFYFSGICEFRFCIILQTK